MGVLGCPVPWGLHDLGGSGPRKLGGQLGVGTGLIGGGLHPKIVETQVRLHQVFMSPFKLQFTPCEVADDQMLVPA